MVLINSAKPPPSKASDERELIDYDVIRVWSYIILLVTMLVPEVLTMVYSLYRMIMKRETIVDKKILLWVSQIYGWVFTFAEKQVSKLTISFLTFRACYGSLCTRSANQYLYSECFLTWMQPLLFCVCP